MIYASHESFASGGQDQNLGYRKKQFVAGEVHGVLQGLWRDWVSALRALGASGCGLQEFAPPGWESFFITMPSVGMLEVCLIVLCRLCFFSDTK